MKVTEQQPVISVVEPQAKAADVLIDIKSDAQKLAPEVVAISVLELPMSSVAHQGSTGVPPEPEMTALCAKLPASEN